MGDRKSKVNLNLTFRAALLVAAVGLGLFGAFDFSSLACRTCWKDVTQYYFSVFGYIAGFGFAIGWTLPASIASAEPTRHNWNTREGFWEGSLGLGTLVTAIAAAMHLLS